MTEPPAPTAVPEATPGSAPGSAHENVPSKQIQPNITLISVRNSADQEIKDAVDGVLRNVVLNALVPTTRMLVSFETVQNASPIRLYYLKEVFRVADYPFEEAYEGSFIRDVMLDILYPDVIELQEDTDDEGEEAIGSQVPPSQAPSAATATPIPSGQGSSEVVVSLVAPSHPASQPPISRSLPSWHFASQAAIPVAQPVAGHFSRAIVSPLPQENPRGVHGRVGDLVKHYTTPHSRYSGRPSENQSLSMHQAAYYNQARLCNLTAKQALQCLINMVEPQSLAAHFYFSKILDKVGTLEDAFEKLFEWDRHHSTLESTFRLWRSLRISQFKTEHITWAVAMEKLYERATLVHAQVDPIHKHDTHLIEVLQAGIRDQPFYMFVERSETAASSHQYFQNCLSAIARQEDMENIAARYPVEGRFPYQVSGLLPQTELGNPASYHPRQTQPALLKPPSLPTAALSKNVKTENAVRQALFSRAGRRYGRANSKRTCGGKNPIGRDGKRMLCRGCNADDHFIADCTMESQPRLIAFASEALGDDALNCSGNEILDMIQNLPDNIWEIYHSSYDEEEVKDQELKSEDIEPKETLFSTLAENSAIHGFIGEKALTRFLLLADLGDEQPEPQNVSGSPSKSLQMACVAHQPSLCAEPTPRKSRLVSSSLSPLKAMTSSQVPTVSSHEYSECVMLDNGGSGTPSGMPAYLRYCKHVGIEPHMRPSKNSFVGIGYGIVRSLGIATMRMPLGDTVFLDFETEIVSPDVALMFGLGQHRKHGCNSDEYQNTFTHHPSNTTIPVKFKKGHLYIEWPTFEVLFTKSELKNLHDRFGHPTSKSLINLLKRARPQECNAETRKILRYLETRCKSCQTFAPKPYVYKVSMPMDDIVFNHEIEVDLFWIEGKPVLHIIDRGTRYSVARFIESQTAEYFWNMIIDAWVTVFTGFPNIISHDRGSQFSSEFFRDACAEFGIIAKETPTESHNSLSLCERYYRIIRRVLRKIKHDYLKLDRHLILSLAVHAVNTTTEPDRLTPSILVFGAVPKLPIGGLNTIPSTQKERFKAMKTARKEMLAITAERRLAAALNQRKPRVQPFIPQEGDLVRIYREGPGRFEGPYPVHSYDQRKTVWVEAYDASGRLRIVPFSLSQVRPFREEHDPQGQVISKLENLQQQMSQEEMPPMLNRSHLNSQARISTLKTLDPLMMLCHVMRSPSK